MTAFDSSERESIIAHREILKLIKNPMPEAECISVLSGVIHHDGQPGWVNQDMPARLDSF